MKISFIVLTYNRVDALIPVLRSLAAQCGSAHEVLIADDGSRPDQVDFLVKNCPRFNCQVRHVWEPDTGFTAARSRNLAARQATGTYLVFLDGDCVPNRHFVAQHTRLASNGFFVNGSRVLLSAALSRQATDLAVDLPGASNWFWLFARLRGDCNKLLHLAGWPLSVFRVQQGFRWRGIRSCNFGVWRKDFIAVNGFDETFQGWGHEDADLVLRLDHLGVRRINGFFATEVFHLWHAENKRNQESSNRERVVQRMASGLVQAQVGLKQIGSPKTLKITQLQ